MNTSELLMIASSIVPERAAIVFDGKEISFANLQERVNRLASALAEEGVGSGDRVATMQVNCNQCVEIYFAAAQMDAIYVPLNFRAKAEELDQMLAIAEPKVLFCGERYLSLVNRTSGSAPPVVLLDGEAEGVRSYEELLQSGEAEQMLFPEGDDEETTVIMFTAGTTGVPKGVMLTHESFSGYLLSNVEPADTDVEETNLLTVPFYHIAGLQAAMAAVYGGRTLVVMRQFEPVEWLTLVQERRANRAMLVPTMLKRLMDHPRFGGFRPVVARCDHLRSSADADAGDPPSHPRVPERSVRERFWTDGDGVDDHDAAAGRPRAGRQSRRNREEAEAVDFDWVAAG